MSRGTKIDREGKSTNRESSHHIARSAVMHRENFDWVRELQNVSARLVNIVTNAAGPREGERGHTAASLAYDIVVTPESVVIDIELPGVAKEDVSITMGGGKINVACERKETEHENGTVFRRTRRYGTMTAQFDLPTDVEIDYTRGVAAFSDGILRVTMPRKVADPGVSIPIQ